MSATAITWTEIANLALTRINQKRLGSIDDNTVMAERIRDIRALCATEVLEEHDWGTATARALLSPKAGSPVGLWLHHYAIPSDLVRVTAVWNYETDSEGEVTHYAPFRHDWKHEGGTLYLGQRTTRWPTVTTPSAGGVAIAYVSYTGTGLGYWSSALRRCVALKIAADLAVSTAGGVQYANQLDADYQRALRRAQTIDVSKEGAALRVYSNDDHQFHHGGA